VVIGLANGGLVAAWTEDFQDAGGGRGNIFTQRFEAGIAAVEQRALSLKGALSVADVDAGSGTLTATISVTFGILNINVGGSQAAIVSGQNSGSVVVSGTREQLNALLVTDGTSNITYTANSDTPQAEAQLTIVVNDNGNSGEDPGTTGTATNEVGSASATTIAAVNDRPVVGGFSNVTFDAFGTINVNGGGTLLIRFTSSETPSTSALVDAVIQSVRYTNGSDTPPASVELAVGFQDGSGGLDVETVTVALTPVDDPATAQPDAATTDESGTIVIDVLANDTDVDGPAPSIAVIDGQGVSAGDTVTLASGALVTLNGDGTVTYDPNSQFDTLTTADRGAVNTSARDTFSYRLDGATATANVAVTITGEETEDDLLLGDGGANTINGTGGSDTARAGGGNDRVGGKGGNDSIEGEGGNDALFGDQGNDRLGGGADNDYLSGGAGDDALFGDADDDFLAGGDDNDSLDGGAGVDQLHGGSGNDRLGGQDGDDYADGGIGDDGVFGDNGNDRLRGGTGSDYVAGGAGTDALFGDDGNDFLTGGDGDDYLDGGTGADQLHGGTGNDRLKGKDGDDYLNGDGGIDALFGDNGNDTIRGGEANDYLAGGIGNDTLYGDGEDDFLVGGDGDDYMDGGTGADQLHGGIGNDTILGSDGIDYADGGAGNDNVAGGAGNDTLRGGLGDDVLTGGAGADVMDGESGADSFRYLSVDDSAPGAADLIKGFVHLVDEIDLSRIDANEAVAGDQGFTMIGEEAFAGSGAGSAGQLRAFQVQGQVGNIWKVEGDTDGDGNADVVIQVDMSNADPLTSSDFVM